MIIRFLKGEFFLLLRNSRGVGVVVLLLGLFSFIIVNNVFGLVPYVFTGTAHFSLTFSLAIPLLNGLNTFGWLKYSSQMFAHLVPQGTPTLLLGFIVIIETIRNSIRPLTLSVRLGANIIAGHLLLRLIGGAAHGLNSGVLVVVFGQLVLLVLEVAVAFIQAYVFVTLICLYFRELEYVWLYTFISYSGYETLTFVCGGWGFFFDCRGRWGF